jgi:thiol:disulfide interchange protein
VFRMASTLLVRDTSKPVPAALNGVLSFRDLAAQAGGFITCKVNERVALADPAVRKGFSDGGVTMVKADWTRQDPQITRMLEANGRAGVPLYLFYPRSRTSGERPAPAILPQILTADAILRAIRTE